MLPIHPGAVLQNKPVSYTKTKQRNKQNKNHFTKKSFPYITTKKYHSMACRITFQGTDKDSQDYMC